MSYPWRQTQGWIDCRPEEFRKNKNLPKPSLVCSKRCIYNFYCRIELAKMTLLERIQNIRITLQKPYHFFNLSSDKSIILVLEDDDGQRFTFKGRYMLESIEMAEKYINQEKKMGSLRIKEKEEIEEIMNKEETTEEKNEEEEVEKETVEETKEEPKEEPKEEVKENEEIVEK